MVNDTEVNWKILRSESDEFSSSLEGGDNHEFASRIYKCVGKKVHECV